MGLFCYYLAMDETLRATLKGAIDALIELGGESLIDPSKADDGTKFGLGIAKVQWGAGFDLPTDFLLRAAIAEAEDFNLHEEARAMNEARLKVFPNG